MNNVDDFVDYVMSFYGKGGLYDFGATPTEVRRALNVRLAIRQDVEFDGDTLDREMVRDIMLANRSSADVM